jgi:hypothetical protein
VVPHGAARTGIMPSSATLHLDVALAPKNAAALSQYANGVATPGSALYHRYLAKGQFAGLFGATNATINAVLAALRTAGLHPGAVSADHLSIPVTATVAQASSAFGVSMASYRLPGGRTGYANTSAPKLPASIASSVEAVIGLDNLNLPHSLMTKPSTHLAGHAKAAQPAVSTGGPQPCTQAVNFRNNVDSQGFTAFTADQLAFAYDFSDLYKAKDFGRGVAVGIVEFGEPNSPTDISDFQQCYGTHTKISYDKVDHFGQTGPGEGEAALDIETVLSLAPSSSIIVYQAPNTGAAAYDIYRTMVDQDKVRVISESYGLCEHYQDPRAANAVTLLYEQAAVQGQTIVASSGDAGAEACLPNDGNKNRLSVNFPASDPLVLGIGGTRITNLVKQPGEVVWNDGGDGDGAGGGGKSVFYSEPSWQKSFGIKSKVREVPDVSADADPETGYIIIHKKSFGVIGGTSAAAPLWAALIALTDAKCSSSPVGWANPAIYFAASPHVKAAVVDDIRSAPKKVNNNYTHPGPGHPYPVTKGYDAATGLGTPIGAALAGELCKLDAEPGGYWLATANGRVSAFHEPFHGSLAGKHLSAAVVGIAGTSKGGYWLVTAKGQVSAFGAPFHGSVKHPNGRVVGIAADKSGSGYWVVTNNGHVYAFNAPSRGSAHTSGVVGIAADPQTNGYWVATSKGKVFAFHAKGFKGKKLSGVTAIGSDPRRQGYWLVTSKGKVSGFGISSDGNMPANVGTVTGIAGDPASGGYWLATATGHVGAFFAAWHGDQHGSKSKIVGIAGG